MLGRYINLKKKEQQLVSREEEISLREQMLDFKESELNRKTLADALAERLAGFSFLGFTEDYIDSMSNQERMIFLRDCHALHENKAFIAITEMFITKHRDRAGLDSNNMAEVNYNRAIIDGIMQFKDFVENKHNLFEIESEVEIYDKTSII